MNTRQTTVLTLLIATVAVIAFGAGHRTASDPVREPAPTTVTTVRVVSEDDIRWDCQTMGNHVCGPTASLPYDSAHPAEDIRVGNDNDGLIVRVGDDVAVWIPWQATEDCTVIPVEARSWVCTAP